MKYFLTLFTLFFFLSSNICIAEDVYVDKDFRFGIDTKDITVNGTAGEGFIELPHQSSEPSAPSGTNDLRLFVDSKKLKYKDSSGVTQEVGSGGGTGGINYIDNYDFELTVDGVLPSGWYAYDDASTTAPDTGHDADASNITFLGENTSPLRGNISAVLSVPGVVSSQGEGASYDFTLDKADKDSVTIQQISFNYEASANYATDDIKVFVYNKDTTTLLTNVTGSIVAGGHQFVGTFPTDGVSDDYRVILHVATGSVLAYTLKIDNFVVGPKDIISIPDPRWPSYTGGESGAEVTVSSTFDTSVHVASWFIPEQDADGTWYLSGGINYTHASDQGGNFVIDGILTDATQDQAATVVGNNNNDGFRANFAKNDDTIYIQHSAVQTSTAVSFSKIKLASKPTWATKTAPDVYLGGKVNVDVVLARVYGSDATSFTSSRYNQFQTTAFDSHGAITNNAGGSSATDGTRFTAPFDGYYQFHASAEANPDSTWDSTDDQISITFFVNGSTAHGLGSQSCIPNDSGNTYVDATDVIYLEKDDYVTVRFFNANASAALENNQYTKFIVYKIPSPQEVANAALAFSEATEDRPGLVYYSDWTSFTPTGSWTQNTTASGYKKRIGDTEYYKVYLEFSGDPNIATSLTVDTENTIDTSKILGAAEDAIIGHATILDSGTRRILGDVRYKDSGSVYIYYRTDSSTEEVGDPITDTSPITIANSDKIYAYFDVPISGW